VASIRKEVFIGKTHLAQPFKKVTLRHVISRPKADKSLKTSN
jgi:hypothetical protein